MPHHCLRPPQADVNPENGEIYAIELGSAVVYRKASFSEPFLYVDCCATAFTFVGEYPGPLIFL